MTQKTLVICNFPRFSSEIWMPHLWASAKTYYEQYSKKPNDWKWYPCHLDVYSTDSIDKIKQELCIAKPDIFAISLYVWNYRLAHEIAEWVKLTWPHCIIVTGGPQQYIKHDMEWFQKHQYIDASLPGDSYGELCFTEMLDNYTNGHINWNMITDIKYPLGKTRRIATGKLTLSRKDKKQYQFDWSAYTHQFNELKQFESYQQEKFPDSILLSVLETTRGCPYGCTYCDWGGGIATAVLQKSLDVVKQDIDAAVQFDLTYLYLADANFGIFGERDVDIIKYLVIKKKQQLAHFKVGYGGFAKTENRLSYIKEIVEVDIQNSLSNNKELKISLQTLDQEILTNIDRKNISLDRQLEVFGPIALTTKLPLYVEIIMGLPGMTLDKFYYELNVFGKHGLSIQWFEWILLPEAPSYSADYRAKWGINTTIKSNGWSYPESHAYHEIVIECASYTNLNYLEMLLSTSMYNLFVQGGFYQRSIDWVSATYNISHGDIIKNIYQNFFMHTIFYKEVIDQWEHILSNSTKDCTFIVNNENIYGGYYFVAIVFLDPAGFGQLLTNYIVDYYDIPLDIICADTELHLNTTTAGKIIRHGIHWTNFKKDQCVQQSDIHSIISMYRLFLETGTIMQGKKTLLGIFDTPNLNKLVHRTTYK